MANGLSTLLTSIIVKVDDWGLKKLAYLEEKREKGPKSNAD